MNCELYVPADAEGLEQSPCPRDATKECADCGKKLCCEHVFYCCDQYFCEFCVDLHQTADHIPAKVKIKTEHVYPPIPTRSLDWAAYDENTYDGAPDAGPQIVGYGATEHEAIADFREQYLESL